MRLVRLGVLGLLGLVLAGVLLYALAPGWRARIDAVAAIGAGGASPSEPGNGAPATAGRRRKGGGDAADRKIAVVTVPVVAKDMPYEYAGVGTVETMASVVVRPRVDASVARVAVADGQLVAAGDLLVELERTALEAQIAQAEATLVRDQAAIAKAKRDLDRARKLIAANAGTRVTEQEALTALQLAEADLAVDQAAVRVLEAQRDYYTLRAPIAGRLGVVTAKPGALVRAGDQLATIVAFDPVYVTMGLPQRYLADLVDARRAGTARLSLAVPGRPQRLSGEIAMVDNAADPASGLVKVRALVANADAYLWPGTIVDASLRFREEPGVLVVPNEAVQLTQDGESVFVIDGQGRARLRAIRVARTLGGESIVAEGLATGDKVVVDGRLQLSDGAATVEAPRRLGEDGTAGGAAPAGAPSGG